MRVRTHNVKPGDRVRGLGLVVEFSEPETDHTWALQGHVSQRREDGGQQFPVKVVLPNEHVVNVVRTDESFRADRLERVAKAISEFQEDDGDEAEEHLTEELTRIANMPRGQYVPGDAVLDLFVGGYFDGSESPEQILEALDNLAGNGATVTVIPFD